ncbi:FGGY-family carbohydrate kinase [Arthrobacter sp. HMWF013]|uniref:FGGY-family carbohydrate kinase n=1 Tax=Arthrobacter sp. HMWF013 TaxID=2056849 RepID=UPI000D387750|nr:FGGY-family carbohydrate kinase [Arthrobacter sp. HMWF013]PTT64664.1 carbohydrate kinase [Arthrobacter sp. HMWF013]
MAVIAVDAGTTMIKAVGYDEEGNELVVVRQSTSVSRPQPGWAEQDMLAVWDAVVFSVRSVQRQLKSDIDFLAITAQGDGCWLVDKAGEPTGPAILWNDGRAAAIVEGWSRQGLLAEAFHINGSQTFPGLPNAILTWLQQNDRERLQRSHLSLTCGGWLFARMTGEFAIDESDGAAPFMDVRTRRYSPELLKLYDMEWARTLLPELRGDDRRVAHLTRGAALEMGLSAGLPIVMSSYDIASTAIGVGAVAPGQACSILGTTLCTEIVADTVTTEGKSAGLTVALGLPGKYLNAFPTLAGGEVIQWACQLLDLDNPTELADLAESSPPGAGGLAFMPYLSPAGERAPFLNAQARGSFLGLSFEHQREHMARAVLEGLTLVIRDCLSTSGVTPTELRVCGGGAANPVWLQLIADVTGVPVLRSTDTEVGAKGAFLVGLVATGGAARIEDVSSWYVRIRDTFTPDPHRAVLYSGLYEDFLALRAIMSETWPRLASMRHRSPGLASATPTPGVMPATVPEGSGDPALAGRTRNQIPLLEGKS